MRIVWWIVGIVVVLAGAAFAFTWRSAIEPVPVAEASSFPPDEVAHGAQLAAVGNCIACHTVPGQAAFSGGLPLPSEFGTIYSTNITPDPETGIGHWSEAAFLRAMREGVDREGDHLYPAFPYEHFTLVTDEDVQALYAYLMTRTPVRAETPANDLAFPYNIRPGVAAWKALYLDEGPWRPVDGKSEEWNRGAYLAEGLGHCGACHTPRNGLGAEDADRDWGGGEAEGWTAYAINQENPAPKPWTVDGLAFYLRHGWHPEHGISRGPMAEVTGNLAGLPDEDVRAIAVYVADRMGVGEADAAPEPAEVSRTAVPSADTLVPPGAVGDERGAAVEETACATCHAAGRPLPYGALAFEDSTAVHAPNPQNIVNVTLFGLPPGDGEAGAVMPGFAGSLSNEDIVAMLRHLRSEYAPDQPEWTGLDQMVADTRSGEHKVTVRPTDGIERAPGNVAAEDQTWQRTSP